MTPAEEERALTIGSLFSGIGGLELGLEMAGLGPVVWQCELNEFCRSVLAKHWPTVTRFEDVTRPREYPHVDLICGGFPCTDVSSAGKRRGLGGQHSSLWYHFARIVRQVRPSWVVVENVASGARRWLPTVRRDLHLLGYGTRAIRCDAESVGLPIPRARIFVVGSADTNRESARAIDAKVAVLSTAPRPLRDRRIPTPERLRMAPGLPRGLDRVRALGNSVSPWCAEVIGRMILEAA